MVWYYDKYNRVAHHSVEDFNEDIHNDRFDCSVKADDFTKEHYLTVIPDIHMFMYAGGRVCINCAKKWNLNDSFNSDFINRMDALVLSQVSGVINSLLRTLRILRG